MLAPFLFRHTGVPTVIAAIGKSFFAHPSAAQDNVQTLFKNVRVFDGTRSVHIMLFAESKGRMPITRDFVAGPEWKEYTFPIVSFDGIDGHDVMGIAFTGGPEAGAFNFRIDQVVIQ